MNAQQPTGSAGPADDISVPQRPDIAGLRFRRWRGPEDLTDMAAANQRARDAAGMTEVITPESMARTYLHLVHSDLALDLVIVEVHGQTVGYARVDWRDLTNGSRQFFSFCVVEPAQRGQGIGRCLLAWSEARLGEIVASLPTDRPGALFAYTASADRGGNALLERHGWTAVARGYWMARPDLDAIPVVALPPGIHVRAITEAERRSVWEAAREAFLDHRDEMEWDEQDWQHSLAEMPDVSLWVIAFDGDDVAAGVWNLVDDASNARHGQASGTLAGVWTRAPWRRQGLARALIARSLVRLREVGMTSAVLGVDGANPNQAMDLYASLGFEVVSSTIDWRKPLPGTTMNDHRGRQT